MRADTSLTLSQLSSYDIYLWLDYTNLLRSAIVGKKVKQKTHRITLDPLCTSLIWAISLKCSVICLQTIQGPFSDEVTGQSWY